MALVNPNIALSYKPVEIPQQRNMLADAASAMQLQQSAMQMDKYQRDADSLERVRQASIANGGPDNLPGMISALKQSSVEGHLKMALDLEQKLAAKTRYEAYLREQGIGIPAAGATPAPANAMAAPGAAPAMPTAPGAAPAPANAMVVPGAAPAPVNAMAVQTPQQIMNRIRLLSDIDYPGAKAEVDVLKAQLGEMQKKPTSVQEFEYGRDNPDFYKKQLELKRASAPSTKVVLPPQASKEQGARGELLVEQYKEISKLAAAAQRTKPALTANLALLDSGFDTGFGTETKAAAAKVLGALGVADAADYAANAETFLANASNAVLQKQLEQKGPQTEFDAQRIQQIGSQLGKTKASNKFVLTVAKEQLDRDIEQRAFYDKWWKLKGTYDGAEDAWFAGEGGKSLFDRPALKGYIPKQSAVQQIPVQGPAATAARTPSGTPALPSGFKLD